MLKKWDKLPPAMQCDEVREYYDILSKHKLGLAIKRLFDIAASVILLIILIIPMAVLSVMVKADSPGPVFYRQERVTAYGKKFRIHKFRTMIDNADTIGSAVTVNRDSRITKIGNKLRDCRLDELPQLIDVLTGNMSFVGTRPEVYKYVEKYSNEMMATLLLPAGITSLASIQYKDEAALLSEADDVDSVYVETILPQKMKYNLDSIRNFSLLRELGTMFRTVFAVFGKE